MESLNDSKEGSIPSLAFALLAHKEVLPHDNNKVVGPRDFMGLSRKDFLFHIF